MTGALKNRLLFCRFCASAAALALFTGCIETADLGTLPPDASFPDVPTAPTDASKPPVDAGTACASNADCVTAGTFCMKPYGACNGMGVCAPKPLSCSSNVPTVCDCSGMARANACEAALAGESVSGPVPCNVIPSYEAGAPADGPFGGDP